MQAALLALDDADDRLVTAPDDPSGQEVLDTAIAGAWSVALDAGPVAVGTVRDRLCSISGRLLGAAT